MKKLYIKVDVDTFKGMREGVPALVEIFKANNAKATFFISMGPDNSGRVVRRIFTKKGFLKKMIKTNAASVYGFPTLLYGTLLPAPQIALKNKEVFELLKSEGHEIGVHGYDHVKWHDYLERMSEEQVAAELDRAFTNFEKILNIKPASFAAPGWSWSHNAQKLMEKLGIVYTSNTRGMNPFFPSYDSHAFGVLEIPSTLPTLDEVLGRRVKDKSGLASFYRHEIESQDEPVFTIHAELEGMAYVDWFSDFVKDTKRSGIEIAPLAVYAREKLGKKEKISVCNILMEEISGRAGKVATQGKAIP